MARLDFTEVLDANDEAFSAIAGIRLAIQGHEDDLTGGVRTAFDNLSVLATGYAEIRPEEKKLLASAYLRAFNHALCLADQYGALSNSLHMTPEAEYLLDPSSPMGLYSMVEEIPEEFATPAGLDIRKVETAHALLRFLHQGHIMAAFDPRTLKTAYVEGHREGIYNLAIGKGVFHLADLDGQIDRLPNGGSRISAGQVLNTAIQPIFAYYEQDLETKGAKEEFFIFLKHNALNAHVAINCHSAEIDIIMDGDKSSIRFNYNEFINANWRARTRYFTYGLQMLGFAVTYRIPRSPGHRDVSFDQVNASIGRADEGTVEAVTTELIRLMASTTDINCSWEKDHNKKQVTVDDCLRAFFSGRYTNIDVWLREIDDDFIRIDSGRYPHKPNECENCLILYPGKTSAERLAYANKLYKAERERMELAHTEGTAILPFLLQAVRDMPPLEEIARSRRETLGIRLKADKLHSPKKGK